VTQKLDVVCFGEILIRLTAAESGLMLQTPTLKTNAGGAEANVAVSLAKFGASARMVSIVSDNALAAAALGELRRHGVDTRSVQTAPGRMGLYFLTPGAGHRPSDVLYDRANSAFALAPADAINWNDALAGANWLHISGVTAAVSANASNAALAAARAARAAGAGVSIDANYRAKLWEARGEDPRPALRALFAEADLLFADARDAALLLDHKLLLLDDAAKAAFGAFPNLKRMACTERKIIGADHHELTGHTYTRTSKARSRTHDVPGIIDRIGGGDAFAAATLMGHAFGRSDDNILEFAMAAAVLKHYIPGDFNLTTHNDARTFLLDQTFDVRR
jgi:2-dehydro-3-deoxygluconokinase